MSATEPQSSALRLRGEHQRATRMRPLDAEVSVAPRFSTLIILGVLAVIAQATIAHTLTLRDAHLSFVTVLLVWTGLRCGVVTGGWLGFACGLLEDALGGTGSNVVSASLIGFLSGTLSNRFFSDSLPVFLTAIALATLVRAGCDYVTFELVFGERGLFHTAIRQAGWSCVLNCAFGAAVLLILRVRSHWRPATR
jgi:cell shape-determining protein MreD